MTIASHKGFIVC